MESDGKVLLHDISLTTFVDGVVVRYDWYEVKVECLVSVVMDDTTVLSVAVWWIVL